MIDIRTIETAGLGDRSYVVTDGSVAIVVSPPTPSHSRCSPAGRCCSAPWVAPTSSTRTAPRSSRAHSTARPIGWPDMLPDHTAAIHPTHGYGSFCSATETMGDESTIGNEKR